jgi:hypothetical protein
LIHLGQALSFAVDAVLSDIHSNYGALPERLIYRSHGFNDPAHRGFLEIFPVLFFVRALIEGKPSPRVHLGFQDRVELVAPNVPWLLGEHRRPARFESTRGRGYASKSSGSD